MMTSCACARLCRDTRTRARTTINIEMVMMVMVMVMNCVTVFLISCPWFNIILCQFSGFIETVSSHNVSIRPD